MLERNPWHRNIRGWEPQDLDISWMMRVASMVTTFTMEYVMGKLSRSLLPALWVHMDNVSHWFHANLEHGGVEVSWDPITQARAEVLRSDVQMADIFTAL